MLKSTLNLINKVLLTLFICVGINAQAEITYDYMPLGVTPADGSTVSKLSVIEISTENAISNWNGYNFAIVKNSAGEEISTGTFGRNTADLSIVKCTFSPEITEEGTYTVVIPQNSLGDDAWLSSAYNSGRANPEIIYTFTVGYVVVGLPTSVVPEDKSTIASLEKIIFSFSEADYPGGISNRPSTYLEVYDANGSKVTEAPFQWESKYNKLSVTFPEAITKEGTYTINVPAEIFKSFQDPLIKNPQFTLTYIVGDSSGGGDVQSEGAPIATSPEAGSVLNSLSQIVMTFDTNYYTSGELINDWLAMPEVYNSKEEKVNVVLSYAFDYETLNNIILNIEPALTETDIYTIRFPEGSIRDFYTPDIKSPAFELVYTIEGGSSVDDVTISVDPVSGTYSQLDHFTLTIDGAERIALAERDEDGWTNVIQLQMASMGSFMSIMDFQITLVEGTANQYTLTPTEGRGYEPYWPMTLPGSYNLYIPKGVFYFNGDRENVNEEIQIGYEVSEGEVEEMTVVPAEGEVEELHYINMIFNSVVTPNKEKDEYIVLSLNGNEIEKVPFSKVTYGFEEYEAQFNFANKHIAAGTYTVYIPSGVVLFADGAESKERTLTYTINSNVDILEVTATVDPAEGVVDKLSDFTVTFEGADKVAMHEYAAKFPYVALVDEDGNIGTTISSTMVFPFADQPNQLSIGTHAEVTDAGKYALVVPAESLVFNGNEEITVAQESFIFYYEIEGAKPQYSISVSPAAGEVSTDDMKVITITFDGVSKVEFNDISSQGSLYKLNEDGSYAKEYQSTPLLISDVAYTFTPFYPPTELGNYRLIIPARAVYVTDTAGVTGPNDEYVVDYQITTLGIGGISEDATDLTVYGIDGVCVLRNATAQDLKNLQKGIYIVNGKKVAIR